MRADLPAAFLAGTLLWAVLVGAHAQSAVVPRPPIAADSIRALISRELYRDAEAVSRYALRTLPPRSNSYLSVLDLLVEASWRQLTAQPADAESLARAAVDLRIAAEGGRSRTVPNALTALGRVQRNLRHWNDARTTLEWSIALREQLDGPTNLPLADDLNALAGIERRDNHGERAVPLQERSLAIRRKLKPAGDPDVIGAQANLALAYSAVNRLGDARRLNEAALGAFEGAPNPDSVKLGAILMNYTANLLHLEDAEAAYLAAVRTNDVYSRRLPPKHPILSRCEEHIAAAEEMRGHRNEAVQHFRRALAILDGADRPDHSSRARVLVNLGNALRPEAPESALVCYERGGELFRQVGDEFAEAEAWWRQGTAHLDMGDVPKAEPLVRAALDRRKSMRAPESPVVHSNQHDLAVIQLLSGNAAEAFTLDVDASRGATSATAINIAGLTEDEAYHEGGRSPRNCPIALSAFGAAETSMRVVSAWDVISRSRSLVLDELAARRQRASSGRDSVYAELFARRAQLARRLSVQAQGAPENFADGTEFATSFNELMMARQEIEKQLAERNAALERIQARSRFGVSTIVASLREGEALVGFIQFPYWDAARISTALTKASRGRRNGLAAANSALEQRYAAFLVRKGDSFPQFVLLGRAEEINTLAREWRATLGGSGQSSERRERVKGEALRRAIWDPLSKALPGSKTVLIVPDGELHMVNFASLPAGKASYLAETGPTFHMLTAERDVPLLSALTSSGRGILAVGGVDFDRRDPDAEVALSHDSEAAGAVTNRGASDCEKGVRHRFEPLPGSLPEARQVVDGWGRSHSGEPAQLLAGAGATESAVLVAAPKCRAIHLATHGFFAGDCGKPPQRGPARRGSQDLLLRSGVALAGCNARGSSPSGEDDGILTAEEIATSDFSSVDWVVLSACESGVGNLEPGEGVYGLRRALAIAGAKTAIMSLWKVGDIAAQRWMRHLYKARFDEKLTVAEAVRAASLRMLKEQRARGQSTSPSIWGAFIATGAWR